MRLFFFLLLFASMSMATTITFQEGNGNAYSTTDAVSIRGDSVNYSTETILYADTGVQRILIRFPNIFGSNTGQIPLTATIQSATFSIRVNDNPSAAVHSVHQVLHTWTESTVTWNSFSTTPGGVAGTDYASTAFATFTPSTAGTVYTIDMTNLVKAWLSGTANYGIIIIDGNSDGSNFFSEEYGTVSYRPSLTVDFIAPVPEPDTLLLAGLCIIALFWKKRRS